MAKGDLKVGFVGAPRGAGFLAGFAAVHETQVVAVCDIREEVLQETADRYGIERRYTDFEEMVQSDLDIIVVSTPMPLHVPMAVAALRAGKHVLSEVPAATDLQQCWELVQAVRDSGRTYMMAENYCYLQPNVLVRALVQAGLFGEVFFGEGEYLHELKELNEITRWRRVWQTGRNGCTYPTHSLGPVLQWFEDRVASVCCLGSGHHYRDPRGDFYENEDTTLMLCKTCRGGLIKIRLDMLSERPHNLTYYSLQGTEGCYEAARGLGDQPKVWLAARHPRHEWHPLSELAEEFLPEMWRHPPEEALRAGHWGGDYFEVRDFVDSILQGSPPPIDVFTALDFTVPGLVSEVSIERGGAPIPVPDFRTLRRFPEDLPEELRNSSILKVDLPLTRPD